MRTLPVAIAIVPVGAAGFAAAQAADPALSVSLKEYRHPVEFGEIETSCIEPRRFQMDAMYFGRTAVLTTGAHATRDLGLGIIPTMLLAPAVALGDTVSFREGVIQQEVDFKASPERVCTER